MADVAKARAAIAAAIALGGDVIAAARRGDFEAAASLHAEREGELCTLDGAFGPDEDAAWRETIASADDHDVRWLTDAVIALGSWPRFGEMCGALDAWHPEDVRREQELLSSHKRAVAEALVARRSALAIATKDVAAVAVPVGLDRARASVATARAASERLYERIAILIAESDRSETLAHRPYTLACARARPRKRRLYASSASPATLKVRERAKRLAAYEAELGTVEAALRALEEGAP